MKRLTLILGVFALIGCGSSTPQELEAELKQAQFDAELDATEDQMRMQRYIDEASVVTRDGCQYLIRRVGVYKNLHMFGTHKGDCTNPIHER